MKFTGQIVHGSGRGSKIGYPTINFDYGKLQRLSDHFDAAAGGLESLPYGVYAVRVFVEQKNYSGVMHFGPRPTFSDESLQVEIHLLDFNGNLYEQTVTVEVFDKIRDIISFQNVDELKARIAEDIALARTPVDEWQQVDQL